MTVTAPDPGVAAALSMLVQGARHEGPARAQIACAIERRRESFAAVAGGVEVADEASVDVAVQALAEHVYDAAFAVSEPAGAVTAIHLVHADRRVLCLADHKVRVPLAIALVQGGVEVQGAGMTVLGAGRARAVAEPFHFIDDGGQTVAGAGVTGRFAIGPSVLRAFHPDAAGARWRVTEGPVDALCDLQVGGTSALRVTELAHWEMAQVAGRHGLARRPADFAAEIARLVSGARCVRAEIPSTGEIVDAIDRVLR